MTSTTAAPTVNQLLTGLGSGIESTPGVCGGDPCVAGTRIMVWLLDAYPTLRVVDLVNSWAYVGAHPDEIERQIRENEEA